MTPSTDRRFCTEECSCDPTVVKVCRCGYREAPIGFVPLARCDKPARSSIVVVNGVAWAWAGREWVAA